jgi:phosphoserine phosphatase
VLGLAVCCKFGLLNNSAYKSLVLTRVWPENRMRHRDAVLQRFFHRLRRLENSRVIDRLKRHLGRGDDVAVLSASPEFYLSSFVQSWSADIRVLGTRTRHVDGRVEVENLHGDAKAACGQTLIDELRPDVIWVYTDHIDDLPLIRLATHIGLVSPSARLTRSLERSGIKFEIIDT